MFLLKNAIKGETYVYFAVQKREGKKTRPVRVKSFGKLSELLAKDPRRARTSAGGARPHKRVS